MKPTAGPNMEERSSTASSRVRAIRLLLAVLCGVLILAGAGTLLNTAISAAAARGRSSASGPPATNSGTWTAVSSTNAPSGRSRHTAVWTGSQMIVWGGSNYQGAQGDGARYTPAADTWRALSTAGTPDARAQHTAVWTGSEMIVWGGWDGSTALGDGARYDPETDTWLALPTQDAPSARRQHTAVWTGSEMIVWGGYGSSGWLRDGARYDPTTDTWTALAVTNAPSERHNHAAIWTGTEMIVWGGSNYSGLQADGARYDPTTDTWIALSSSGAPSARTFPSAVWSGSDMIIWGGQGSSGPLGDGARYNPLTDAWTALPTSGAPSSRYWHTALWTGDEMIVWGGWDDTGRVGDGAQYNPTSDRWTDLPIAAAPNPRNDHTAVWTGSSMIVWGGYGSSGWLQDGARYHPLIIPASAVQVSIGKSGFDPAVITITVGATVVWTNDLEETVHMVSGTPPEPSRLYLPLMLGEAQASGLNHTGIETASTLSPEDQWGDVFLSPGEIYSHRFTQVGDFPYFLKSHSGWSGQIIVEPVKQDTAMLAWATGEPGVLLRWRWPKTDSETGDPAEQPTGYNVYRDGEPLNSAPITRVVDETEATAILGTHWDWITDTYSPTVTTIASLHTFLTDNPLAEQWLANQRYPVALIRGLGYLDDGVKPADPTTHIYRVEALLPSGPEDIGTLSIRNDGVTPLPAPGTITATVVVSDALRTSPDWVLAQTNRKGHGQVFLSWDLPAEPWNCQEPPETWITSYDISRAGPVKPGDDPGALTYDLITDQPVVPMPNYDPFEPNRAYDPDSPLGSDPYNDTVAYDRIDYYYVDAAENLEVCNTYAYRVAPRDLLGQTAQWSRHDTATVPDLMPPDPPAVMTPEVDHLGGTVRINWQPVTDAVEYRVYRSTAADAGWPGLVASDCITCPLWVTMPTNLGSTDTTWTDTSADLEQRYWYVVRALDQPCPGDPPNESAPSQPVTAILHDRTAPGDPDVARYDPERGEIQISTTDDDTAEVLLYCSFGDCSDSGDPGEMMLVGQLPTTDTQDVSFPMDEYYTPAAPVCARCQVQPVDSHGNRGELTDIEVIPLCPSEVNLEAPVITGITTTVTSAPDAFVQDLTALITWDADDHQPGLVGFRIYRQEGLGEPTTIADEIRLPSTASRFEDSTVQLTFIYSYTVAAVHEVPKSDEYGRCQKQMVEVRSADRLYKAVPTLDCCTRSVVELPWATDPDGVPYSSYTEGVGTRLKWLPPYDRYHQLELQANFVVYRSLEPRGNYVAITPPLSLFTQAEYLDRDAEHDSYWYVVTMLDWTTMEIFAQTTPWSAGAGVASQAAPVTTSDIDLKPADRGAPRASFGEPAAAAPPEASARGTVDSSVSVSESIELSAVADSTIFTWDERNHGREDTLRIANHETRAWALLQFDLSRLPAGATIESATFSAFWLDPSPLETPVQADLCRITGEWDEYTVAWADAPGATPPCISAFVGPRAGSHDWDVTELVRAWRDGTYPNYGLRLHTDELCPYELVFSSREGTHPPSLLVSYEQPALPTVLRFGTGETNVFRVTDVTYTTESTLDCLTGSGMVALGGDPLETYDREVTFNCIKAQPDGLVTSGEAEVTLRPPIQIQYPEQDEYPEGPRYNVASLRMYRYPAQEGGEANLDLVLPDNMLAHDGSFSGTSYRVYNVAIQPDLTFIKGVDYSMQDCTMGTPSFYFEMNPLPLRVVPMSVVVFTERALTMGVACTQYEDRYGDPWDCDPHDPNGKPCANDGFLRPRYDSNGPATIWGDGLEGWFQRNEGVSYATVMPYGFYIDAVGGAWFYIESGDIKDGLLREVDLSLDYYQVLPIKTLRQGYIDYDGPTGQFLGHAQSLAIGPGGALSGVITTTNKVSWASGGFVINEDSYFLYVPPIRTNATRWPWEEARADWSDNKQIQAGLNLVKGWVDFNWYHCGARVPTVFPEGVSTDLYLRHGGVSDEVKATISAGNGVRSSLHTYDTTINSFVLSFCDNYIHASAVEGDVWLPFPTKRIVPLVDMQIDDDTACATGGEVRRDADPLALEYWQIVLHPGYVEFRARDPVPSDPVEYTHGLWLMGTMEVPHLALPGETITAAVPLETCFDPDGDVLDTVVSSKSATYALDGFNFLLSGVRLSDWLAVHPEEPSWDPAGALSPPPSDPWWFVSHGFVQMAGNIVTPLFGTLQEKDTDQPPDVFVLGWDDYVGFSKQPRAERSWTVKSGITWSYHLVYAHHYDQHIGMFAGYRPNLDLPLDSPLLSLPHGAVIEPGQAHMFVGLSSGASVLMALAETTQLVAELTPALEGEMGEWAIKLGMDAKYANVLKLYNGTVFGVPYVEVSDRINAGADDDPQVLRNQDLLPAREAGTGIKTPDGKNVKLLDTRGQYEMRDAVHGDWDVEAMRAKTWFDAGSLLMAKSIPFEITRDGVYHYSGKNIESSIFEYVGLKIDFDGDIDLPERLVELGVLVHDLPEIKPLKVKDLGGVFGVGPGRWYIGLTGEASYSGYGLGGAFLFGDINPSSTVLRSMGYGDLLDKLGATGKKKLTGFYIRVSGSMSLIDLGCVFRVGVGADVALWYFANQGCDAYGGRVQGNIHGKLLCVVGARGDLSLEIWRPSTSNGCAATNMRGQFWVAGGIGFCSPGSWKSWEKRWWGDSWCWTCGAVADVTYNGTTDDWSVGYDACCE